MTQHTQPHDWRWRLEQQEVNCIGYRRPYEVLAANASDSTPTHMVTCNKESGVVFVKEYDFFINQKGDIQSWGKRWRPVVALDIEHARALGCKMFPEARPYYSQRLL